MTTSGVVEGGEGRQTRASRLGALGLRIVSGVILGAIVLLSLWVGRPMIEVVLGVAVLIGAMEYAALLRRMDAAPPLWLLLPLTGWLLYRVELPGNVPAVEVGVGAAVVGGLLGATLLPRPVGRPDSRLLGWMAATCGALYLGLCLGYYLMLLRWHTPDLDHFGMRLVVTVLLGAIVGDSAALFGGAAVGRHPFFPAISPRKTSEGAIIGALAATAVVAGFANWWLSMTWVAALGLGALIAVVAQGGDLVESALKRRAGVKDSGTLIPGHGGALDRLDSLVLLGPVVYCYLRIVGLP